MRLSILIFLSLLLPINANASDLNWRAQLAGLDGVSLSCVSSTREKYAAEICDALTRTATTILDSGAVPAIMLGLYAENDVKPRPADGFQRPLVVEVFLRGTNQAILTRIRASVRFQNAVEAGTAMPPRTGDLVIWERSKVGSGPLRALQPAITKVIQNELAGLLSLVLAGWQR